MAAVETLISDAKSYVAEVQDLADDAIDRMRSDINNIGFTAVSFGGVPLPSDPPLPDDDEIPTIDTVTLDLTAEPTGSVELQPISPIEPGTMPVLDATAPTISLPSAPSALAEFDGVAPTIKTDYVFPDTPPALDNPFPAEPTLSTITMPATPTLALPSLTAEAPTDTTVAPSNLADEYIARFRELSPEFTAAVEGQVDAMVAKYNPQFHTQMAALESAITDYMDGGTGLDPAVENAIYERARAKTDAEARRVTEAAFNETAARGFTIPAGVAAAGARRSRQAAADINAQATREIVVMQAEMEQKNKQFAMQTSLSLRQMILSAALNYHSNLIQINGQAIEHAKSIVSLMVESYNVQVRAFGVRVEAYRAQVSAYEARLRGTMAAIDLFKAEIDGQQALLNADRAKIDLYRSRIDALDTLAKVYRSKIETILSQAGLEKLKLDLFRTQVEAYVAKAQGKRAEFDAFQAAISGQEARVRIFGSQVQAFGSQVQAHRTQIEAQSEVVRAQAISNDAKVKQFTANLDAYKTISMVRADNARAKIDLQGLRLKAFETGARVNVARVEASAAIYSAKANVTIKNADLTVQTLIRNAELNLARAKEIASMGLASAQVYQGLAGSALSGMNTLVAQTLAE